MTTELEKTSHSKKHVLLTEGDVQNHLFSMSIPMAWGILAIIAIQVIDMFFISMLGDEALTSISFTFPVTYAVFSIFFGFGIAMSSVVSRLIGSGRHVDMHRVLFHGFILVFSLGAFFSLLGILYAPSLFSLMGASGSILDGTLEYMYIWFSGAVLVSLPLVGNSAIRASGDSKTPAFVMAVTAMVNLILDPILIFGLLGFPEMGIRGAALATILSYTAGLIIGFYVMVFKLKILVNPKEFKWFRNFYDSTRQLIFIAVPAALTSLLQPILNSFIIALLASTSVSAVAAYGVVTRVEALLFVPIMALASGVSPIIGQNYGADLKQRVRKALCLAIKFSMLWSLIVAGGLMLFGEQIVGVFAEDKEIISIATLYFLLVPLSYVLGNIIPLWSTAFNATAKPHFSFSVVVFRMVVLSIPICWIGAQIAGFQGIFIGIAFVNIVSGVITHALSWRYVSRCGAI